jgi:hypothetical protein
VGVFLLGCSGAAFESAAHDASPVEAGEGASDGGLSSDAGRGSVVSDVQSDGDANDGTAGRLADVSPVPDAPRCALVADCAQCAAGNCGAGSPTDPAALYCCPNH